MRLLSVIILVFSLGCNGLTKSHSSYWETQKDNFKYQNKSEFVSDSLLRADYKNLKTINHPMFDPINSNPVYLYSWQDRDPTKNEFTIIKDDGELGLKIFYFILDKKDSLISSRQIAGRGGEGGYWFETRSKFLSRDTLLNIGAITQWYDDDGQQKLEKPKGDTTFSYFLIDSKGEVSEKVFKEVKDLNFENQ